MKDTSLTFDQRCKYRASGAFLQKIACIDAFFFYLYIRKVLIVENFDDKTEKAFCFKGCAMNDKFHRVDQFLNTN